MCVLGDSKYGIDSSLYRVACQNIQGLDIKTNHLANSTNRGKQGQWKLTNDDDAAKSREHQTVRPQRWST